jgi:hypothetical protein
MRAIDTIQVGLYLPSNFCRQFRKLSLHPEVSLPMIIRNTYPGRGRMSGPAQSHRAAAEPRTGHDVSVQNESLPIEDPPDQISYQRRQSVVVAVRGAVFDGDIPAFDEASLVQAPAEAGHQVGCVGKRCAAQKPNQLAAAREPRAATPPRRRGA